MNSTYCDEKINSIKMFDLTRKINIYLSLLIVIIGLLGNSLAVLVFAQKRFRNHSSSIYLLSLCISDGAFLTIHFFEDTLRTLIDVYLNDQTRSIEKECLYGKNLDLTTRTVKESIFRLINITDRFDLSCRLVNYLRYFFRFFSAYLILTFTIQRAIALYWPFIEPRIKSSKYACLMISLLIFIGLIINKWTLLFFNVIKDGHDPSISYCDIKKKFSKAYFFATIFYAIITMILPIVTIVGCNILIIAFILKNRRKRQILMKNQVIKKTCSENKSFSLFASDSSFNKGYLSTVNHKKKISQQYKESKRITRILILMSFSYVALNLPYFIAWSHFFYQIAIIKNLKAVLKYKIFSILNICEIFYVMNFAVNFFIYCLSGKKFRNQLKNTLY